MFSLRQGIRSTQCILASIRPMSSSTAPLVDLTVDNEGIAILTMQRSPVNSLNLELLQEISKSIDEVVKNKSKGLVLASASPTVFSAGLDIMELYKPDLKRAITFWTALQDVWLKLFGCPLITSAAINGYAPAGGCLLAISSEHRVMVTGKGTIGLNEAALGVVAPKWLRDTMIHTISMRQAEKALTACKLFTVDEALKIGLIDETATDKADAIEKSKKFIRKFDKIPAFARTVTKQSIREPLLKRLQENRQEDVDFFLKYFVHHDKAQECIGVYIENLKKKTAREK